MSSSALASQHAKDGANRDERDQNGGNDDQRNGSVVEQTFVRLNNTRATTIAKQISTRDTARGTVFRRLHDHGDGVAVRVGRGHATGQRERNNLRWLRYTTCCSRGC